MAILVILTIISGLVLLGIIGTGVHTLNDVQFPTESDFIENESVQDLRSVMLESYLDKLIYEIPTVDNLDLAQSLFATLLRTRILSPTDIQKWSSIEFNARSITDSESKVTYAVISEKNPKLGRGHGFYMFNQNLDLSQTETILQAPHRPSDAYTHEIVFDLLVDTGNTGPFMAAAISTTYRENVDLCKEPVSYFNEFTVAVANVFTNPKIIQLHGFEKSNHNTTADVIFSSTKKQMPLIFEPFAECLKKKLSLNSNLKDGPWDFNVFKYPEEIQVLGGTLNINAAKFYQQNPNGMFFHVETSKQLRNQLRIEQNLRNVFVDCFGNNELI